MFVAIRSYFKKYNYFVPSLLIRITIVFSTLSFLVLATVTPLRADSLFRPLTVASPYDLINAVNALRTTYGLAPYRISSILMNTAQAQADFMAATEDVTHSGPGGIGLTARLLAAGYPLAGDLSAGGFRAENISSGNEDRTAESVVEGWSGDALHLNTMISPNLSEIGAGVAVANGRVYFVIDCALPTTDVVLPATTDVTSCESLALTPSAAAPETVLSTPNSDGDVIHEVQPGQSLWQLAIAYNVKIEDIKRLNNLFDDNIYPGNKLLIKQDVVQSIVSATGVTTAEPNLTSTNVPVFSTATILSTAILPVSAELASPQPVDNNSITVIALGIIAIALLVGGVFMWLGIKRKADD